MKAETLSQSHYKNNALVSWRPDRRSGRGLGRCEWQARKTTHSHLQERETVARRDKLSAGDVFAAAENSVLSEIGSACFNVSTHGAPAL